ncbi:DUF4238 domain-containing protein [Natronococcus occultus]|uniref:DUF4238 domain-containing protein n=1 Tax=Natronococcus occultus SP4 TaxID=694430 RepID=L0JZT2_9EURY|nr:DUF4238 domain-containing protein [Natronococcus occultus]AGB37785.1 hypothetical protein Natoc_1998 [Natronococcus occultus SP4]
MPARKNQHYVPQHYLRAWATNEQLEVFHLDSEGIFSEGTSAVCSRDYFYGNPPIVETELAGLEGYQARPINRIREGDNLTDLTGQTLKLLYSFVTTQRSRTKATKETIRSGDPFLREAVKADLDSNQYNDSIEWTSDLTEEEKEDTLVDASLLGTHQYIISLGVFGYISISDLKPVMLYNVTDQDFIISDAPTVHDIPQYKHNHEITVAGLSNRGLQIFCPIDKYRTLLLYDPAVYRFDTNSKKQILIKSPSVVDQLNLLQFHNAEDIIMFDSSDESYIRSLYERSDEVRQREERTISLETESGIAKELPITPAYQIPSLSPNLPNCTTMTHLPYTKRRPASQSQKEKNLVNKMFNEAGAPDLGLIYAIRTFESFLDLE